MSIQILNEDLPDDVIVALLPAFRHDRGDLIYSDKKKFRLKVQTGMQRNYPSMSSSKMDGIVFRLTDPPNSGDFLHGYTIGSSPEADVRIKMPGVNKIMFRIHFNPDNGVLLVTNLANKPLTLATTRRDNWKPQDTFVLSHEFSLKFALHTRGFIGLIPNSKEHDDQRRVHLRKFLGDKFLNFGHPLSPPCEQITTNNYAIWGSSQLGRTRRVCNLVHRDTGGSYAGKYFLGDASRKAARERDILKTLKENTEGHEDDYIIRTFGVETMYNRDRAMIAGDPAASARTPASCLLVMELCPEDLGKFDLRTWTQDSIGRLLYQICAGLRHIHNLSLIHGNIQPENILVKSREPVHVKISGFGAAFPEASPLEAVVREALYKRDIIVTGEIEDAFSWNDTYIGYPSECPKRVKDTTMWEQICNEVRRKGSIAMRLKDSPPKPVEDNWYRAPEIPTKPTCKSDIWSVGVIALQHHYSLDDLIALSMSKMVSFHDLCYELRSRWIYTRLLEYHVSSRFNAEDACELFRNYMTKKPSSVLTDNVTPEHLSQMSPEWGDDRDHDVGPGSGFTTPFYHYSSTPLVRSPVQSFDMDDGASDHAMRFKFSPTRRRAPTFQIPGSVAAANSIHSGHESDHHLSSEFDGVPPKDTHQRQHQHDTTPEPHHEEVSMPPPASKPREQSRETERDDNSDSDSYGDDELWEQLLPPSRPSTPQNQSEIVTQILAVNALARPPTEENTETTVLVPTEIIDAINAIEAEVVENVVNSKVGNGGANSLISSDFTLPDPTILDEEELGTPGLTEGESNADETIPRANIISGSRRRSVVKSYKGTRTVRYSLRVRASPDR